MLEQAVQGLFPRLGGFLLEPALQAGVTPHSEGFVLLPLGHLYRSGQVGSAALTEQARLFKASRV
jgi:hypothetical protein